MASMDMTIKWQRRRAEVTLTPYQASYNNLEVGTYKCHVLGLFQVADGEDAQPYFVCELDNGCNICATPQQVRFLDTTELNKEDVGEEE